MKLQTLRADRLEAEAEVRDARLEAAVLGLTQAHGGGEAEKQMRAQREALREARLGLDAAAATSVFASVALEPHTGGGPTEDGAAARRFHSQLLAAAALEPGGREVSVHAGWSAAAGHGAGAPAADVGGGEEGGAGARALAALEAMRGMGQDALARDVTLSRAGGAGRWRCVFSTRRSALWASGSGLTFQGFGSGFKVQVSGFRFEVAWFQFGVQGLWVHGFLLTRLHLGRV